MQTTVKINLERGTCRITTPLYLGGSTPVVFDQEGTYSLILTEPFSDSPADGIKVYAQSSDGLLNLTRKALLNAFIKADARHPNMTVAAKVFVKDADGNVVADGETAIEYAPQYIIDTAEYPSAREVLAQATAAKNDAVSAASSAQSASDSADIAKTAAISAKSDANAAAESAAEKAQEAKNAAQEATAASATATGASASAGTSATNAATSAAAAIAAKEAAEGARDEAKESVADFEDELASKVPIGEDGKIPSQYLPSYVDDVLEYASLAVFPAAGEKGKIYVATDTGKTYRWADSIYVEISKPVEFGETQGTAYEGNKGKALETELKNKADKTEITVNSVNGKTGAVVLTGSDIAVSSEDATKVDEAIAAKYTKPANGIPASDLASGVIPTIDDALSSSSTNPIQNQWLGKRMGATSSNSVQIGYGAKAGKGPGQAIEGFSGDDGTQVAVGRDANGTTTGTAVGRGANGSNFGVAVGADANGSNVGVAVGYGAKASSVQGSVAVGRDAIANSDTPIVIGGSNFAASAQITVSSDGVLKVGGKEMANKSDIPDTLTLMPKYPFADVAVADGVVTLTPYARNALTSDGTAFTVTMGGVSGVVRDCVFVVDCTSLTTAPTISWGTEFHPRTDAATDFACVAGEVNVYWITEYVNRQYAVAGWQVTEGGNA